MHKIKYEGGIYATHGDLPDVGSRAPDVSLVNTSLQDVSLANFLGLRKVLNVFTSIDTEVCARSVVTFDALAAGHESLALLMISYDLPFAHARFQADHDLENVVGLSAIRHAGFGENYGVQIVEGPLAGCSRVRLWSSTKTTRCPSRTGRRPRRMSRIIRARSGPLASRLTSMPINA